MELSTSLTTRVGDTATKGRLCIFQLYYVNYSHAASVVFVNLH